MRKAIHRTVHPKILSIGLIFSLICSTFLYAQQGDPVKGKTLFNANCASCHSLDKRMTGPALRGVGDKYDKEWIYNWVHNSSAVVKSGDAQAVAIFTEYKGSVMTAFPQLTNEDIDNVIAYTMQPKEEPAVAANGSLPGGEPAPSGASNQLILAIGVFVLLVLVIVLILVNRTLRNIAKAKGVEIPEKEKRLPLWKAFAQNQFLVLVTAIFLLLASAYYAYGYLMQIGVDQGYMPIQPIHFSHKIHAGANKIDCQYCHSSARVSKTSGIPSLNVCMNCHKYIGEYKGEEDLQNGYTKAFYDNEIQKLYKAVGWDAATQNYTNKAEPVKWVRIHNLPDFAYFNHAQHVTVAGVACQTCHGPVEEMEIVYQHAPLTMGWCVTCHRETNIQIEGNAYYEKIHAELSKKYGVEKLTAAQMGGLECGKCHY